MIFWVNAPPNLAVAPYFASSLTPASQGFGKRQELTSKGRKLTGRYTKKMKTD
jgi:hypothetical protein